MKRALILALVMILVGSYGSMATTTEFPSWLSADIAPISGGYGEAVVGNGQDIFLLKCLNVNALPELHRYSATSGTWSTENTAPLLAGTFRNGTALAWDGANSIYALAGARYEDTSRTVFLQYQVEGSTWSTLPNTPFSQGAGDALAWSGYDSSLYAFVGSAKHNSGRSYFLRYDPAASTWSKLPFLWSTTEDGAALAWTGGEYLYALRGEHNETVPNGDFARFHIPSQTWEQLASLPAIEGVGDGGSLLWIGEQLPQYQDYIFALSGGAVLEDPGYGFYRYSTSLDEWESLENIPCPIGYYVGNRLAYATGGLYYWQGSPKSAKWVCGGTGFYKITLSSSDPQPPLVALPDTARLASAQQEATLPDGTKVLLYDDFTWHYSGHGITYDFDFSTLSSITLPEFLRQGFQVAVSIQTTAVEMYLLGWRYTMPIPKSSQAAWGNSDGRTTWYYGYWYNSLTDRVSATQPLKKENGLYYGDGQDHRRDYRRGGSPRLPTKLEWLLSQSGGVKSASW